mmetsp:Transcript_25385/g.59049  ORF Transcript_25385/g.59049 Transcript_25385/m.59049 type:complete len:509 (-) Transcript_25385:177-1703(-)
MATARGVLVLFLCIAGAVGQGRWVPCGCSWSSRGGCGISSEELLHVLSHSKVDELCLRTGNKGNQSATSPDVLGDAQNEHVSQVLVKYECGFREQIHKFLPKLRSCPHLAPKDCVAAPYCEWGAQQEGKCGVDEEKLVMDLAGEYNHNHPLVQFIVISNDCRERGEQSCEIEPKCEWHRWGGCDMKEAQFYKTILQHPRLVRMLDHLKESTFCHAYFERNDFCIGHMCRMEYGICRANSTWNHDHMDSPKDMYDLVHGICETLPAADCVEPCINHTQAGANWCRAPEDLPEAFYKPRMDRNDWYVFGLMLELNTGTYLNERFCNYMDSNQTLCLQSDAVCDANNVHRHPTFHAHPHPVQSLPANVTIQSTEGSDTHGGVGLDGVLGELSAAASNGKLKERFDSYKAQNPQVFKRVEEKVESLFESAPAPPPTAAPSAEMESEKRQLDTTKAILMVVPIVIIAALCAGIATGTTCTLAMWRRNQPRLLLPEENLADYAIAPEVRRRGNP